MKLIIFSGAKLLLVVLGVLIASGCESRRQVKKTIKGPKTLVYNLNIAGNVDQQGFIYTSTLVDELGDEVDYNTVIESAELSSLSIAIEPKAGNTAAGFKLSSLESSTDNATKYEILDLTNYPTTLPLDKNGETIVNNLLLLRGVDALNGALNRELVGKYPRDISRSPKFIQFRLRGTSVPASARIAATLILTVDITLEYTTCMSVPEFLFSDNPKCN